MIYKTTSPDQLRATLVELKEAGFTQIENHMVGPNWKTGENFIETNSFFMIWSYCLEDYAVLKGYSILTTLDE